MTTLRVVTLNMWNREGSWRERFALAAAQLRVIDPDVVLLQEIVSSPPLLEQLDCLAEPLGFHRTFGRAPESPIGNAILSRYPIAETIVTLLPRCGTDDYRCIVSSTLETPFGNLPTYVTHLNWRLHEGSVRLEQVAFLAELIASRKSSADLPAIVGGDFNAEPDSDEILYMSGLRTYRGKSVYFADCFRVARDPSEDARGVTFSKRNPYAAVCREPERRLDYIFVQGSDPKLRGMPLSARVCLNVPDGDLWPSDHFGVVAEIDMGGAR